MAITKNWEVDLNRDLYAGSWKQLSGKVREQWSTFCGDETGANAARIIQLHGSIQVRQAISKQQIERRLREFVQRTPRTRPVQALDPPVGDNTEKSGELP